MDLALIAFGIAFIAALLIVSMLQLASRENPEELSQGSGVNRNSEELYRQQVARRREEARRKEAEKAREAGEEPSTAAARTADEPGAGASAGEPLHHELQLLRVLQCGPDGDDAHSGFEELSGVVRVEAAGGHEPHAGERAFIRENHCGPSQPAGNALTQVSPRALAAWTSVGVETPGRKGSEWSAAARIRASS